MRFLADESCDFALVRALRQVGHDVTAVKEIMPGAEDEKAIDLAVRESRVLLTEDKDFGQLVFASSVKSAGVILIRYPAHARQTMVKAIVELIQKNPGKVGNHFVVVQPGRIRISQGA